LRNSSGTESLLQRFESASVISVKAVPVGKFGVRTG
jgi:hypothetical protein